MLSPHISALVKRLKQNPPFRDPYELHSPSSSGKRSAVAVLLAPNADGTDLEVVLTKRTGSMAWANEVVFPGGKLDKEDPSLCHCALREADEEISLFGGRLAHPGASGPKRVANLSLDSPSSRTFETEEVSVELLTELPLHLAKDALVVNPYVFLLKSLPSFVPVRNPREVAPRGIFRVPLSYFLGPMFRYTVDTRTEGHHSLVEVKPPESVKHEVSTSWWKGRKVHYFDVPVRIWETDEPNGGTEIHKVTWMTADILVEVASIAYAAKPSFEFNDDWAAKVSELGHWVVRSDDGNMRLGRL